MSFNMFDTLPQAPPCGDPCCAGWIISDEVYVEKCDACAVFEFDDDAFAFIANVDGHLVSWTLLEDDEGEYLLESEPGSTRGVMHAENPEKVWSEHRAAAGASRFERFGISGPRPAGIEGLCSVLGPRIKRLLKVQR